MAAMAEWELQMPAHRETMAKRKRNQDKASRPTDDGARAVKRRQGSASSSAAHAAREARRSAAALAATPQGQLRLLRSRNESRASGNLCSRNGCGRSLQWKVSIGRQANARERGSTATLMADFTSASDRLAWEQT